MNLKRVVTLSAALIGLLIGTSLINAAGEESRNVLSADDAIVGIKQTTKGKPNTLSAPGDYGGEEGNDEQPTAAVDGDLDTKYLNQAKDGANAPGINTGFVVTPKAGPTIVTALKIITANDMEARDPLSITLEGSNDPKAREKGFDKFTLIYEGPSGLDNDPGRQEAGKVVSFRNNTAYTSYRVLVTKTRETTDSTQYTEVMLLQDHPRGPATKP